MKTYRYRGRTYFFSVLTAASLLATQGCVATRDWVREQMDPLSGRVSQTETRLNQAESQLSSIDGRVGGLEGKLGQIDAKADKALTSIANLRLDRKFVIDMKEGANFAFNSSNLPSSAKKEIDGFLSDLRGDPAGMDNTVFLVAGHTDNVGSQDYNYELGKKRADAVSRYLITEKKMDPVRIVTVSYGATAPLVDNSTAQQRAKNRRVEILVYRDGITSAPPAATAQGELPANQQSQQSAAERVSQR
jgi:peptidoglycan-associated lipoprotein